MKTSLRLAGFFLLLCLCNFSFAQVQWEYLSELVPYKSPYFRLNPTLVEVNNKDIILGYSRSFYILNKNGHLRNELQFDDQIDHINLVGDKLLVGGQSNSNCNLFLAECNISNPLQVTWNIDILVEFLGCNYLRFNCVDFSNTYDNGYIMMGDRNPLEGCMGPGYVPVIRIDKNGNIRWQKKLNGLVGSAVVQAPDEGFYLGIDNSIIKIDGEGNIQWKKSFGTTYKINSVLVHQNGNCFLAGDYHVSGSQYYYNWLVSINPNGEIIWQKTWARFGIKKIIPISNGDILAVGGGEYAFVSKINAAGEVIWDRHFEGKFTYHNIFLDIIPSKDQGWILLGKRYDPISPSTTNRLWVVKLHSYDCLAPDCDGNPVKTITYKDQEKEEGPEAFKIYPNPFNDLTTIASPYKETAIQYQLFSMQGMVIENGTVQAGYASKDWSHLAPGVYLIEWSGKYTHGKTKIIRQ